MNDLEVRLDESCRRLADGGFLQSYAIERDGGAGQATVGDRVLDEIVRQWGLSAGELDELSAEELDLYGGEQLLGCRSCRGRTTPPLHRRHKAWVDTASVRRCRSDRSA